MDEKELVYLDYNATTPIAEEVGQEMLPFLTKYFGNPSSSHLYGKHTKNAVEKARGQIANLLGCSSEEIIITSGGTEANNYAIKGAALQNEKKGKHIITSQVEHPAVFEVCRYLEKRFGFRVSYISVDEYGTINIDELKNAITPQTTLITIMHANNEVGTIQPISEIATIAHQHGIIFHTDASQSIGKIPTKVNQLGVDLLTIAGHKLYAPKGIGALYVRKGVQLEKFMHGANHERNYRAGTENVLEAVGLGKACELIDQQFDQNVKHMQEMRDLLLSELKKRFTISDNLSSLENSNDRFTVKLNGNLSNCLPNTLSLSFKNLQATTLLHNIREELAISAGAACHSEVITISHVLEAMHVPYQYAQGTLRFSTGKYTSREDIEKAVDIIEKHVKAQ